MTSGNLLSAIQCSLDDVELVTAADLQAAFDFGKLTPLLPGSCWWLARVDGFDELVSLESIPTAEVADHSPQPTTRDGGLLILSDSDDGDPPGVRMTFFPACDSAAQFARAI